MGRKLEIRSQGSKWKLRALTLAVGLASAQLVTAEDLPGVISADDYFGRGTIRQTMGNEPENLAADEAPSTPVLASCEETIHGASACGNSIECCPPTLVCPTPWWGHRTGAFADILLLRPGSTDLIYAVEQTDPIGLAAASPTGPVGIANIDEEAGFRTGFALAASNCSSLVVSYAWWDGETLSTLTANAPNVLNSQVIHPSVDTTGAASLAASSMQGISFQTVDTTYRHLWKATEKTAINWLAGLRYGNLEQTSSTNQTVQVATGLTNVRTDIGFDGFGITGGADFERYSCQSGLSIYGRSMLSLLAGDWQADYVQTNQFGGGVIANQISDYRVTPIIDTELGLGWTCMDGRLRVRGGFLLSAWLDAMTTRSYIDGVRTGQIQEIEEVLTFSGLTSGLEFRF